MAADTRKPKSSVPDSIVAIRDPYMAITKTMGSSQDG